MHTQRKYRVDYIPKLITAIKLKFHITNGMNFNCTPQWDKVLAMMDNNGNDYSKGNYFIFHPSNFRRFPTADALVK